MTSQGEEFSTPVRNGYSADNDQHRRNWKKLEDFLSSPFIDSAHILDATVDTAHIADASITNAKIESLAVDKLTAGTLSADVLLSGNIKTALTGQRVEITSSGIKLTDGTSDTVNIPVEGSASFNGGVTASGLDVTGNANLRGNVSLEVGASMTLEAGVSDPSAPAALSWVYDMTPGDGTGDLARRSASYESTATQFIVCSPTNNSITGYSAGSGAKLWRRVVTTPQPSSLLRYQPQGVVVVGAKMWVLARDEDAGSTWLLSYAFASGLPGANVVSTDNITTSIGKTADLAGLTYDGSHVLALWLSSGRNLNLTSINPVNGNLISAVTLESSLNANLSVLDVVYRSESSAHYWVAVYNSATTLYSIRAYSNTPARVASADFGLPGTSRGITHDGTRFWTFPASTDEFRAHTNWTSTHLYEHIAYTWFSSAGPSYTTLVSTDVSAPFVARAKLRVSMPDIPAGADAIEVYAAETDVTTVPSGYFRQVRIASTSTDLSIYDSGGLANPVANTFPVSGTPGYITSASTGAWKLTGSGIMKLPTSTSAPAAPVEGQVFHNTTTHKTQVWDGSAWQNLF